MSVGFWRAPAPMPGILSSQSPRCCPPLPSATLGRVTSLLWSSGAQRGSEAHPRPHSPEGQSWGHHTPNSYPHLKHLPSLHACYPFLAVPRMRLPPSGLTCLFLERSSPFLPLPQSTPHSAHKSFKNVPLASQPTYTPFPAPTALG